MEPRHDAVYRGPFSLGEGLAALVEDMDKHPGTLVFDYQFEPIALEEGRVVPTLVTSVLLQQRLAQRGITARVELRGYKRFSDGASDRNPMYIVRRGL
ncbi:MAG: hypothetical protein HYY37_06365 [Candidatus Aenigmarchaeota archaeon]|nr:hypothetical protein [Candidatus Aenigmarchaeota archaeon]